jgi:hypothetical protein
MNAIHILDRTLKHLAENGSVSHEEYQDLETIFVDCYNRVWNVDDFVEMGYLLALGVPSIPEEEENGMHKDDDGDACDCDVRECGYNSEGEAICPKCGASAENLSLVHGDHGMRCDLCKETFTCP